MSTERAQWALIGHTVSKSNQIKTTHIKSEVGFDERGLPEYLEYQAWESATLVGGKASVVTTAPFLLLPVSLSVLLAKARPMTLLTENY